MRIGIDARFFGGEQSKGLGRYTQKLVEYLAQEDHENEYVVFVQHEAYRKWSITAPNITPVLAPFHWYTVSEQLFMPFLIWRSHVDLMHFPHFNVPLLYHGSFIATIHDLIIIHFPTERATTLGPLLYKFKHIAGQLVMRHAVKNAQHVLTVSEFSKQDIAQYYHLPPERITVTYEASEPPSATCNPEHAADAMRQYGIQKPYLLYVGNAYPHKNLEVLLDTMKAIKDREGQIPWNLVLVGRKDYFYSRLEHHAWAYNIDDHVVFPGFVSDADLPCLYQHAEAYIFPSKYEGFGLPPLEAMMYGTPVIAANSSCLPEILGDAALYFDPDDISGIIKAVNSIRSDPAVRRTLIEKGTAQVQRYSWRRMMQQTRAIYERTNTKKTSKTS